MDQIEYILDEFPFDKVWQAMRAVGWKWGPAEGRGYYYPTFTELRRRAKKLLEAVDTRVRSGGFEAIRADGILELNFVLASASSEDCDKRTEVTGEEEGANAKGLYGKYKIEKADGTPTDPYARYFVLRVDTDPHAKVVVQAYADSVLGDNPKLAIELIKLLADIIRQDYDNPYMP